ncbi:ABC transporter ATP-binding protein [Actinotignum urinale]|uniref:ABC transporter ATP-binding protein n=1 Tax=Actinotignum urinale TaxID=190146 RepID=A0ABU5G5Q4_9ACTO|nr:ABC transporter ATP-binding protein [Actinotignum urinale]MDY5132696.1 ABC transporter ATP-binding protein [Actinotignum urinale]MDY5151215.1 ABC transporter ATP-binding protein [Actinotignum urinale]
MNTTRNMHGYGEGSGEDATAEPPALATHSLTKHYGAVHATNDITLTIRQGEILSLLGPNGAGKSTTLDVALGLIKATSGTSELFGMKPRDAIKRGLVGYVQQKGALLDDMSILANLNLLASTMENPVPKGEILEMCNLTSIAKRKVGKCSGGEQQRIRLATALLSRPRLLILDEPTAGMDTATRAHFWEFIQEQARQGVAILYATHYLAEAQAYAERTIILNKGRIIADEPTRTLREKYAQRHLNIDVRDDETKLHAERAIQELEASFVVPSSRIQQPFTYTFVGNTLHAEGADLDNLARTLLNIPGTHNLEMTTPSLEEAYLNLVEEK